MIVAISVIAVVVMAAALWWLLIHTEGVYLGQRVVIWLYDAFALRYDALVAHDDIDEHVHLAQPLMQRFNDASPHVLDVGTGTGRLPLALCQHARFQGHIIACDPSRRMLRQAMNKVTANHFNNYVSFAQADGQGLPHTDATFDCVTCLEVLEFTPQPEATLAELARVLRPGGLLLTTLRINEPWMPGRVWSQEKMQHELQQVGIEQITFEDWQYDYMKVWGRKRD